MEEFTMTKIHNLHPEYDYLSEYELENLGKYDFLEVWYYYMYSAYEGSGTLLAKSESGYYIHDLSHCSCFGPLDNFNTDRGPLPLDKLWEEIHDKHDKEMCKPLFEAAGLKICED
jgi:hypothetical protein